MTDEDKQKLLDCFATEAMKSIVSRSGGAISSYQVAETAYTVAERMLERRQNILNQWKLVKDVEQDGIEKLELTVRTERCLKAEGILTIQHLCCCTERRLMKLPNLGRKSLNEIIEQLAAHNHTLRDYT